jgi:hypothetical protein
MNESSLHCSLLVLLTGAPSFCVAVLLPQDDRASSFGRVTIPKPEEQFVEGAYRLFRITSTEELPGAGELPRDTAASQAVLALPPGGVNHPPVAGLTRLDISHPVAR